MDLLSAILSRRSIRHFEDKDIPTEVMEQILSSAMHAPSAKNRQPWKFIVITNSEKPAMLNAMKEGIANEKKRSELLPENMQFISGAEHTMRIMEQAPVTVFVFNTEESYLWDEANKDGRFIDIANIQSIGAAIENMLLTATALGVGSLWICDIFIAYHEICQWLHESRLLVAAVSFGYSEENPAARPRKELQDMIEWRC